MITTCNNKCEKSKILNRNKSPDTNRIQVLNDTIVGYVTSSIRGLQKQSNEWRVGVISSASDVRTFELKFYIGI